MGFNVKERDFQNSLSYSLSTSAFQKIHFKQVNVFNVFNAFTFPKLQLLPTSFLTVYTFWVSFEGAEQFPMRTSLSNPISYSSSSEGV
jgi:hypothetical protein